ncbi:MAG: prephenate dehydrogenase/arogenate dehydrogenase family protein [Desulfovibrionaceae bacterium]|nr:prephenate dehydrogenase/arogenate dehydrogenase family protein [Desulfovibrionaceae bacterium]
MDGREIKTMALAGASGRMGRLICERAREAAIEVRELGRPLDKGSVVRAVSGADLVLLSVPVTAMAETLERVCPFLDPDTILIDVCSVKVRPMEQMLAAHPGPVVGAHPLFGPEIPEGFTPRVALVPGRGKAALGRVFGLMSRLGFSPFEATAEQHDRAMAYVQGLNFTTTVVFLASMRQVPGIEMFVTPSLKRRLDSARKMMTEDQELFATIAEANPFLQETVRQYMSYLGLAAGGDLDLLAQRASWWWRG